MFSRQKAGEGAVTPFQAVTTALSATVGTGNIVGTTQAIALGGYGAVFWMWLAALMGMVTKYSEVVLSIRYRERDVKGDWVGGPMYYIRNGMGKNWKWLGSLYCIFAALAAFGIGNGAQAKSIVGSLNGAIVAFVPSAASSTGTINLVCGIVLAVLVALILFGGIKRIGEVCEKLVPFMSAFYILFTLIVIISHISGIGHAFYLIFASAFTPRAVFGATSGIVLKQTVIWGMRRSAFSNEAGLGSAAIAHAAAETKGPVNHHQRRGHQLGRQAGQRADHERVLHGLRHQVRRALCGARADDVRLLHDPRLVAVRHALRPVSVRSQGRQGLSAHFRRGRRYRLGRIDRRGVGCG